jgi:hypothetical protein
MTKNEIIDFCLDNGNLSDEKLAKELSSKLNNEAHLPYRHEEKSIIAACRLENSPYIEDGHLDLPHIDGDSCSTSKIIEIYESKMTKRELSFALVSTIRAGMEMIKTIEEMKKIIKELM